MGISSISQTDSFPTILSNPRLDRKPSQGPNYVPGRQYVLMTAAYNEETTIEQTILSVLSQTILPCRWVIVSDGSSDNTDEIVQHYAEKHDFIRLLRVTRSQGRSFGSKVLALRRAWTLIGDLAFDFVGNVDADVSLNSSYFEDLMARFGVNPNLGLAAGFVFEKKGHTYQKISRNRLHSVVHAAQLARRECYDAIGGYAVLEFGGEDWFAEVSARMMGWTAEAFPDLPIYHHRPTGEGERLLRYKFREGRMDYSFGSDPLFEAFKCLGRMRERPFIIGGIARWTGFVLSCLRGMRRPVSEQFMAFLRESQRERLRRFFSGQHLRVKEETNRST